MSQTKVALPDDILVDGLSALTTQQAPPNPVDILMQPVPALPADAPLRVATDFGAQVQQIQYEEAEKIRVAQQQIDMQAQAFDGVLTGSQLVAEGTQELLRMRDSKGLIEGLYNLVSQGPKRFFKDELGITEREARIKIQTGQTIAGVAQARLERDSAVAAQQAAIRQSLLNVGSRTVDAAGEIVEIQNKQTDIQLRKEEGNRAAARFAFDKQKFAADQRKLAVDNLMASASSVELEDLVSQVQASGQSDFEYADPLSGAVVRVPLGYLAQQTQNKKLAEAQLMASITMAAANQATAASTLDGDVLKRLPINSLRQIASNDGLYSIKNPEGGDPIQKQFDTAMVGAVLAEREKNQPLFDAARHSVTASTYAAAIQALGPNATDEDIASIPVPPEIEQVISRFEFVDTAIDSIQSKVDSLGIADDLDVQAMMNDFNNDSAEMNTLRLQLMRGQVALTPEVSAKIEKAMSGFSEKLVTSSEKLAGRVAGGDKDIQAFVTNSLMGRRSTPANAANAFFSLALQPEAAINADASQATRSAMTRFNDIRGSLYKKALEGKGVPTGKVDGSKIDQLLAEVQGRNKEPVLTKEERRQLDIEALNRAALQNRNTTRDAILKGDLTILDPEAQAKLAKHPYTLIENLSTFDPRADDRAKAQLRAEKLDLQSKDAGIKEKAQARYQDLYYTNYAQLLLESRADGFNNGLDAFVDFVKQPAFGQSLRAMASGTTHGGVPDQVANQLFGPRTANGLIVDFDKFIRTGENVRSSALESQTEVRRAYRNDGVARLSAILEAMPNEIIGDQDSKILLSAVQQRIGQMNADGRVPSVRDNNSIENVILHQKFEDPKVEDIRKRVAKEWSTASRYADKIFFIQQQTPTKR